jgi:tRNA(adenine34) deaminase
MNLRNYMFKALSLAGNARAANEVPVGALIVCNDSIVAEAYNQKEMLCDPTAHVEILAIRSAAQILNRWRLSDCTLFVTLEPCPMCASAIYQARLQQVVFGAYDLNYGACGSVYNLLVDCMGNDVVSVVSGVCQIECKKALSEFFDSRRQMNR